MLSRLSLLNFRCFEQVEFEFGERVNFFVGPNAVGKTSVLEAICVLLRLQSPRVSALGRITRHGSAGFSVQGSFEQRLLQFYYGSRRKKLALDRVEQSGAGEYLTIARVVYFGNDDREIPHGSGEARRRFMDFVGMQTVAQYRETFRRYQHALRSRNALLRGSRVRRAEVEAFDGPLAEAGETLVELRGKAVAELSERAPESYAAISGGRERFGLSYLPSVVAGELMARLRGSFLEDVRLRSTGVGPHRDDLGLSLDGVDARNFASEGQQRTMALALKLAHARLALAGSGRPPTLLMDDIFGELDPTRRRNLLGAIPQESGCFITTTSLAWAGVLPGKVLEMG